MKRAHRYDGTILFAPKSEEPFFSAYRKQNPGDRFMCLSIEEVAEGFALDAAPELGDYLRRKGIEERRVSTLVRILPYVTKDHYKSGDVRALFPLRDDCLSAGMLRRKDDFAPLFRDKVMLIRGYYSGKRFSEVLQDVPNINLGWDLNRPQLKDVPCPCRNAESIEEAHAALREEVDHLLSRGEKPALRYEGEEPLPEDVLKNVDLFHGPFPPYGRSVLFFEEEQPLEPWEDDPVDALGMAELHLPSEEERRSRGEYDEDCFLRHPFLCARVYLKRR